jgi:hypothetical protein
MSIKLTPITNPKDQYQVCVQFMHGDADGFSSETYVAKNEEDFVRMMKATKTMPDRDDEEYYDWFESLFRDSPPRDSTCDDYCASIEYVKGFYYDANGVKFEASVQGE